MEKTISPKMNPLKIQSEIPEKNYKVRSFIPVRFMLFCFLIPITVFSIVNL